MGVSILESGELHKVTEGVSRVIDFHKDLPANVFRENECGFWFFERSLIDYVEIMVGLVSASYETFSSDVFVRFGGEERNKAFLFDGEDIEGGVEFLNGGFRDFFGGEVNYPIVMGDLNFDWVAFESAHEEFGVLAVRNGLLSSAFIDFLEANLMSPRYVSSCAVSNEDAARMAKAFREFF